MKTFAKIKSGAFTLIELLAAMTITTVLVLVIVALTSRGGWISGDGCCRMCGPPRLPARPWIP